MLPIERQEQQGIQRLITWGERQPLVRAMLLTSSRTNPEAPLDLFSDYDVIIALSDIRPLLLDEHWLEDFGRVLTVYRDPIRLNYGQETFTRVTHYEDGPKIDFTVWPVAVLQQVAAEATLPAELDLGYSILLDKDQLTRGLQAPTMRAFIPTPPSEAIYRALIDEFFNDALYVAKNLWRGDLLPAKYCLDTVMKLDCLRQMLEWRMEIDHGWSVKPGALGKGMKKWLSPALWQELEQCYVGADQGENWLALFTTIDLFRNVASDVGERLGYAYPHGQEQRVRAYLHKVQGLDQHATSLG